MRKITTSLSMSSMPFAIVGHCKVCDQPILPENSFCEICKENREHHDTNTNEN